MVRQVRQKMPKIVPAEVNIRPLFPNAVTMTALAFGVSSINMSLWGNWEWAVAFIMLSMVFDFLDGKVARMLGVSSRFGAELDSLSDFVSFGVAPGVLMYLWTMKLDVFRGAARAEAVGVYWVFALFLALCCATRLARFNSLLDEKQPSYWTHFFMGVPAPAGAGLAMFPIILWLATKCEFFHSPLLVGFFLCFSGVMMASRIPTLCLKHLHVSKSLGNILWICALALLACLFCARWETLSLIGCAYLISIPISIYYFFKFKKAAGGK